MVGVPARRIGWMCQCGERLPDGPGEVKCEKSGDRYRIQNESCMALGK
jgi:UDP-2-acetamido-3-amino-2,3-dideoxy-glucuronate N-acetyltransferase